MVPARRLWRPEFGWEGGGRPPAERMRRQQAGEDLLERLEANMSHHWRSKRYETCWEVNKKQQNEFLSLANIREVTRGGIVNVTAGVRGWEAVGALGMRGVLFLYFVISFPAERDLFPPTVSLAKRASEVPIKPLPPPVPLPNTWPHAGLSLLFSSRPHPEWQGFPYLTSGMA